VDQASPNSRPSVGLCFSRFRFVRSGTTCVGRGVPIRSRAISLTAVTARKRLGFFFFTISTIPFKSTRESQELPGLPQSVQ